MVFNITFQIDVSFTVRAEPESITGDTVLNNDGGAGDVAVDGNWIDSDGLVVVVNCCEHCLFFPWLVIT